MRLKLRYTLEKPEATQRSHSHTAPKRLLRSRGRPHKTMVYPTANQSQEAPMREVAATAGFRLMDSRFDLTSSPPNGYAILVEIIQRRRVSMSTQFPSKPAIERRWHILDANGVVLGKLASDAAKILMGKTKASWTPFLDTGDHVIVINADKVVLTGKKDDQKLYRHFTGYPGRLVETKAKKVRAERPIRMIEEAISGMLPKTKLGKQMYRKLKVYPGDKHPHAAQKPVARVVQRKTVAA